MIDAAKVTEIVATYERYGWQLRRLLLTPDTALTLAASDLRIPTYESGIDAGWFSRPPADGPIAWELRYLGEPAFALLEHLDESSEEFEAGLKEVEGRMDSAVRAKRVSLA